MSVDYEYDVAFSFHSTDEALATELNDLLEGRFKTFLYSKKQEVLAGFDGEEKFNAIFGAQARCVVVLYRPEWGETPFTRIEQTAIRNRGYEHGYDFSLIIPTSTPPAVPPWLPKTRLWFGLSRFGIKGAAAVIEARVQEAGGEPRVETVAARAARYQRSADLQEAKRNFRESVLGVREAKLAYERLTESLTSKCAEIANSHQHLQHLKLTKLQEFRLLSGLGLFMSFCWRGMYANSLAESSLTVDLFDNVPKLPGLHVWENARRLQALKYDYELVGHDRHGYVERSGDQRDLTAEELADHLLQLYMDRCAKL
ncbi:hypothetical protein GIW81_14310 [Hyphomicrobium sp. xq]|uniref:TIR domain-containing protein n=1 Tax=Hyphomicrobium album TaxID=2665159 RepID=A0A6I3KM44_9HYPH|nr:hypothetical protein [Hyphomicrobium album]MTD95509.1 hypothetical protein [Hyphomicrobium album]